VEGPKKATVKRCVGYRPRVFLETEVYRGARDKTARRGLFDNSRCTTPRVDVIPWLQVYGYSMIDFHYFPAAICLLDENRVGRSLGQLAPCVGTAARSGGISAEQ